VNISVSNFSKGIKSIADKQQISEHEQKYMSNINNYLTVHTTNFMPKKNQNGKYYIETYSMGTDFSHLRNTIHTTLNHIVESHAAGNWDNHSFIILAPFDQVIAENGKPTGMDLIDTFFSVDTDKGLVLPQDAHIVRPADDVPDGVLFLIDKNETKYKSNNYTENEITKILSLMKKSDRKKFESGDKDILAHFIRNMAAEKTAAKMGYDFIKDVMPESKVSHIVKSVAEQIGTVGSTDGQGHGKHISLMIENIQTNLEIMFGFGKYKSTGLLGISQDFEQLYSYINDIIGFTPVLVDVVQCLIDGKQMDFYKYFDNGVREEFEYDKEWDNYWEGTFGKYDNIGKLDKNLDGVIKKYCAKRAEEFNVWRANLETISGYDIFLQKLKRLPSVNAKQLITVIQSTRE
jgi:hypothetical protein